MPGTSGLPSATGCAGGFHSLAGSAAIAELARAHGLVGPTAAPGEPAAAALVREAVRAEPGTPAARFLDALADRLVLGAASVVAVLDPGCLVLGGEVGRAGGDRLATLVATRLAAMSPLPTEVRASAFGGGAVLRGALLMARDGAQDDLFAPTDR